MWPEEPLVPAQPPGPGRSAAPAQAGASVPTDGEPEFTSRLLGLLYQLCWLCPPSAHPTPLHHLKDGTQQQTGESSKKILDDQWLTSVESLIEDGKQPNIKFKT